MRRLGGKQRGSIDEKGLIDAQSGIILLFVLAVIGGGFWYVLQHRKDNSGKDVSSTTKLAHTATGPSVKASSDDLPPQRYNDPDGRFTVSYPAAWQFNQTYTGSGGETIHNASFTSPSGLTKVLLDYRRSYIETDCIPDYYDVPFASTNRCFSAEFLTADDIHVPAYQASWYLAHYHFKTITINAKEVYTSCLVIGKPATNQPKMGFFADHPVNHVLSSDGSDQGYLSACVDAGTNPNDYSKPEVRAGENILRSLRFEN